MKLDGLKQNHRVNPPILILYKKKAFFLKKKNLYSLNSIYYFQLTPVLTKETPEK
jgi:hypothetical protein